jgi:transcriptional regulator with XRE-family HTH domain
MTRLGETLREARRQRGLSLEEAERATRIPRQYLLALEDERFSQLPPPVYARGFLRSYASYLGLDPGELLPLLPVGQVEEPRLRPLTRVEPPRTYATRALVLVTGLSLLLLAVAAMTGLGRDEGGGPLQQGQNVPAQPERPAVGLSTPGLVGQDVATAARTLQAQGINFVLVGTEGEGPRGEVLAQSPDAGEALAPGSALVLVVSR